jgi:hypothetical protein
MLQRWHVSVFHWFLKYSSFLCYFLATKTSMELMVSQLPKSNQGHGFVVHTSENNDKPRKHKIEYVYPIKTEVENS